MHAALLACAAMEEFSFECLPFPVRNSQRARLKSYKAAALARESILLSRRRTLLDKQVLSSKKFTQTTSLIPKEPGYEAKTQTLSQTPTTKGITHKNARKTKRDPYVLVGAVIRGYLTRRLFQTEKVHSIVKTIKDSTLVLSELTNDDGTLYQRVLTQLQVARLTLHEIFFELPAEEQMTYIAHSRSLREDRSSRTTSVGVSVKSKQGKLSAATLKARQRREQHALRKH